MLLSSKLLRALWFAAFTLLVSGLGASGETVDPAQAIAQKFSDDDSAPPRAPQPPLAKAAPAAAAPTQSAADAKTVKSTIAKPIPGKLEPLSVEYAKSEPARPEPVKNEPVRAQAPGADYESDMLARAREEELERQAEEATEEARAILAPIKVAGPAEAAAPLISPVASPSPRPSAPPSALADAAPAPTAAAVPAAPPAAAATPAQATAPAALLSAPAAPPPGPAKAEQAAANPPPATPPAASPVTADAAGEARPAAAARATVLLVLDLDERDGATVKPDPIICFDQKCWVSNGLEAPAHPMPRSQAVALKTTDNVTSDSCSGKSGCAYRDIELPPDAQVQVFEVGESGGVSDGAFTVFADKSCRSDGGALVCGNGLTTQSFRMWVVPEATAQAVGAVALENAVAEGLDGDDAQSASDK